MKKIIFSFLLLTVGFTGLQAQKFFTREGKVTFHSETSMEKIEATTSTATSVLDATTGNIEFAVLIKGFQFEKALMQEHFKENYMESDKFPKATFKGTVVDKSALNFSKDGTYSANVKGDLTIHGVTKPVTTAAKFIVKGSSISATSDFDVVLADYKIEIPAVVKDNIAKTVKVSVKMEYQPYTKS